jgi:hypothetical protein
MGHSADRELREAAEAATAFLVQYSFRKPPMYAASAVMDDQTSRTRTLEALVEAHTLLSVIGKRAVEMKNAELEKIRKRQFLVNVAHLVTGSGFVALIALESPEAVKWVGAAVSLAAGVVGLTLPKDANLLRDEISQDIAALSAMAGEVAKVQLDLLGAHPDADVYKRAKELITTCARLSKRYELDSVIEFFRSNVHNLLDKEALKRLEIAG